MIKCCFVNPYNMDDEDEYGDDSNYGFGWGGSEPTKDDTDEYGE